ncbi:sialidase family protein [Patulibacter sp.]|uniref:sialidase family protein n=1 Tax=Patulibacter sp. TaxID=1912859 RepID=UPI00271D1912|nr:sialidase family protein [Patulibacter sp.]MDO9408580.1 sialidase family protein [Patulibacter sp.]
MLPGVGGPVRSTVLPDGRILLTGGSRVATSGDLGNHWRLVDLPGDAPAGTIGAAFQDAQHGIVVASSTPFFPSTTSLPPGPRSGPAVWNTSDGGRSWHVLVAAEPGAPTSRDAARPRTSPDPPPEPRPRLTVTALAAAPDGAYLRALSIQRAAVDDEPPATALERSTDGGRTWTRLMTRPQSEGFLAAQPIHTLGVLADGRIVVPLGGTRELTMSRTAVAVVDPTTGQVVDREAPGDNPTVLCDPAGACLVNAGGDYDGEQVPGQAYPFDGTTFGPPRPPLPLSASSPRPGTIVGIRGAFGAAFEESSDSVSVVRSDDGGASYTPRPARATGTFDDHRVTIRAQDEGWYVSRDGVRWTAFAPAPTTAVPIAAASAPGGVVALFDDKTVRRLRAGRWGRPVSVRSVDPEDVAVTGNTIVVAGRDGVARIVGGRVVPEVRASRGRIRGVDGTVKDLGIQVTDLEVSGRTIVAWSQSQHIDDVSQANIVRSDDGGRTWRMMRSIPGITDLQMLSPRTFYASLGKRFYVSHDAGRTFTLRGATDDLSFLDPSWGVNARYFVRFKDRDHGIVSSDYTGTFLTQDGGRTFQAVPSPTGPFAAFARLTPRGVLVDGPMGTLITDPDPFEALRRTHVDLRVARTLRATSREVTVRITGRTRGIPAGAALTLFSAPRPGAPPTRATGNNDGPIVRRDGGFSATLVVRRGFSVRARYGGAFGTGTRRASALSSWATMPGGR